MRLYLLGKLLADNPSQSDTHKKKAIAYKLYDDDTKETKLVARKDIINAMSRGVEIIGFRYRVHGIRNTQLLELNTSIPNIPNHTQIYSFNKSTYN